MKRLMMTTTIIATLTAGTAFAYNEQMRATVEQQLLSMPMDVEVGTLTNEQVAEIYPIVTSADSPSMKASKIEAIVTAVDVDTVSQQNRDALMIIADTRFPELDVAELNDAQVLNILAVVNSGAMPNTVQSRVEAIAGNPMVGMDAEVEMLRESLANRAETLGVELDVSTLSDEQVVRTMAALSNDDSQSEQVSTIESAKM